MSQDEFDPYDEQGNSDEIDRSRLMDRLAEERENDDKAWLMSGNTGRRIMYRLLERHGIWHSSYQPGIDAMQMAFNEGRRALGLQLLEKVMEVAPKRYDSMLKEAKKENDRLANNDRTD